MKKHVSNRFILICTGIFSMITCFAQDCQKNLEEAQRAYFNGQFETATRLMKECLNQQNADFRTLDAYEVYIKSLLLLDKKDEAEQYAKELLVRFPAYETGYQEILEYGALMEQYTVVPKNAWQIFAGINAPIYQVMKYHSYGSVSLEPDSYEGSPGISVGVGKRFYMDSNISFDISAIFQNTSYRQSEFIQNYLDIRIEERMSFLSLPATVNYSLEAKGFKLTGGLGLISHARLSSKADLQIIPTQPDFLFPFIGVPKSESGYDISNQRKRFTFGYTGFIELSRSFRKHSFFISAAYEYGINNQVQTEERLTDTYLKEQFSYVPDDFKYDAVRISIGYRNTIFKVLRK